jgi:hypothetical protein
VKRIVVLLLALLMLTGCAWRNEPVPDAVQKPVWPGLPEDYEQSTEPEEPIPEFTIPEVPVEPVEPESDPPADNPIAQPKPAPPVPVHTELYIPDVPVEDVVMYFNEVCLDAEIVTSGDPSRLQKWNVPILYQILGDPTDEDLAVLRDFTGWLNTVEGFPGIMDTADAAEANLRIHFCSQDELLSIMGDQFTHMDGAVTFWYENDAIYDAVICIRTDLEQNLRNSVILEELYNSLGPIQDTALRPDSIIYADYSEPQALTAVDELILQLLYHPHITCGMDASQCEAVIRELYY